MSGEQDKSLWPEWLKAASTVDARVEITVSGRVIWKDGTWEGGTWEDGVWKGGVWKGGVWEDGVWKDGIWEGGIWEGGVWEGGVWEDGVWKDGIWEGGFWEGGRSSSTRAMYRVTGDLKGNISIGCKTKTRAEWEEVIAGKYCEEEPDRNSENWRLLVAAFRAQCAYEDALIAAEKGDD